MYLGFHYG